MISIASRDVFGGFKFAAFRPKNIVVVVAVMISPSLRESSMFFLKLAIYCTGFLIIRSFFHTGKDINHSNDVDINNAHCYPRSNVLRPKNIPVSVAATVVMSTPSPVGFLVAAAPWVLHHQ